MSIEDRLKPYFVFLTSVAEKIQDRITADEDFQDLEDLYLLIAKQSVCSIVEKEMLENLYTSKQVSEQIIKEND